jgi:hypothetical protein
MSLRPLAVLPLLVAWAACAETPPPPPPPVVIVVPSVTAEAPPPVVASAAPAPPPDAIPKDASREVTVVLRPGDPPCTLVFDPFLFDRGDIFTAMQVTRIATKAGGACAEGVLYDLAKETKAWPDAPDPEPLAVGPIYKPETPKPATPDFTDLNRFIDMNFDGYADLCVVTTSELFPSYGQRCWLFDPGKRVFVREPALDPLVYMTLHPEKKMISAHWPMGPRREHGREATWIKGQLVTTMEEELTAEERPDGHALPKGFSRWVVRRVLRGGKLVKVVDGPEKDKP